MTPLSFVPFPALALCGILAAQSEVTVLQTPHDGHRPQAELDAGGVLHVVQGSRSSRGDLFYLRQEPGSDAFSDPIRVNTTPGIVAAFDMAVGPGGRVHVLMRTNPRYSKLQMPDKAKLTFFDLKYMLYARLADDGNSFEEERNLAGDTIGFEGVGAILADAEGRVFAFWHGQKEPKFNEPGRDIYRVVSEDAGRTFSAPEATQTGVPGACQCCAMKGAWDAEGNVLLAFRNSTPAGEVLTKDSYLLMSTDLGKTFEGTLLDPWKEAGCPGSTYAFATGPAGSYVAWSTRRKVLFTWIDDEPDPVSPTLGAATRAPVVATNHKGEVLFAWAAAQEGHTHGAGHLVWQLFDANGKALTKKGVVEDGIAEGWGGAAAFARPDGSFVILYDGSGPSPR